MDSSSNPYATLNRNVDPRIKTTVVVLQMLTNLLTKFSFNPPTTHHPFRLKTAKIITYSDISYGNTKLHSLDIL